MPLRRVGAQTVCEQLLTIFAHYGIPDELYMLSDHGSNFMTHLTEELLKKLGVHHLRTSPYHPQSKFNGALERFHRTMKQMIRKLCVHAKDWDT